MSAGAWLGALASLAITLGLLLIGARLLRRWIPGAFAGGSVRLQVLQRVSTGPRQAVAPLRIEDRVLLIATGEGGTRLLTELQGETLARALAHDEPPGEAPPRDARTGRLRLPWLLALAALLTAPPALPAQTGTPAGRAAVAAQAPAAGGTIPGPTPPRVTLKVAQGGNQLELSGAVGIVVLMGVLTLLPTLFLLMTSFTRILIVLHFLRAALGTQNTPPSQLLIGMAVLLTGMVMSPVLKDANERALQPYLEGRIGQADAYRAAIVPFRRFMLANTGDDELATFIAMSGHDDAPSLEAVPTVTLASAFVTSELKTAFQMGFTIFLPFLVVDLVVASVLVSMGMFMLPPAMIALPFKLLLFVLADGWVLVVQNLAASFH